MSGDGTGPVGTGGADEAMAGAALADAVRQALAPHAAAWEEAAREEADRPLAWSDSHWRTVCALGLPRLLLPAAQGGAGASLAEGAAAIEALGGLGDPSPAAETAVLAWLLARRGSPQADDPGADNPGADDASDGPLALAEPGCRVPWPQAVRAVDGAGRPAALPSGAGGRLLHGVPCSAPLPATRQGAPEGAAIGAAAPFRAALAATRAVQIVGAAAAALEMTAGHVRQRHQFGRPLARFQAVQQHMAVAAAELAAAARLAHAAFAALDREDMVLAAGAKIAAGRAGTIAAAAAHQFHGAMGFTAEYPLHRLTRAIWQWREDFGNEAWWSHRLGASVCRAGADRLWPTLTDA